MASAFSLAIDVFYVVLTLQASVFSFRLLAALKGGEISRSWWFIASGMILFFTGSLFQLYMDVTGTYDLAALQPLLATSSALLFAGIYLEYRFWQLR
ncbi:MAG TPA: hypothetical protein VEC92_03005 [Nitrososphaerales archaeon]|nr:hypothetical protein [Nitrososphaerales archaeon]